MDITITYKEGIYLLADEDRQTLEGALVLTQGYKGQDIIAKLEFAALPANQYNPSSEVQDVENKITELQAKLPLLKEHETFINSLSTEVSAEEIAPISVTP